MNARYLLIASLAALAGCTAAEEKENTNPIRKDFVVVVPAEKASTPVKNAPIAPAKNDNIAQAGTQTKSTTPTGKKATQVPPKSTPQDADAPKSMDERPPMTEQMYREKFGAAPPRVLFVRPENRLYKYLEGYRLFWNQQAGAWNPGNPE